MSTGVLSRWPIRVEILVLADDVDSQARFPAGIGTAPAMPGPFEEEGRGQAATAAAA